MPNTELIARARRIVTDPASVNFEPVLMADAFLTLVEARGGVTRFCNLGAPAHRIGAAIVQIEAPMAQNVVSFSETIADACARTREYVRSMRPTGGDAA